ncbi:MAG: polymer-forming cytoskeletal protein, partial [Byssovorax cruenta]
MFGKSKGNAADTNRDSSSVQEVKRSIVGHSAAPEGASSISSGLSIVGKIVGEGTLGIFGHVEGEVHASTVQIGDGAQVEGDIVAEELT